LAKSLVNKLTLKISVGYNRSEVIAKVREMQKIIDGEYQKSADKQVKSQSKVASSANKTNKELNKQSGLLATLTSRAGQAVKAFLLFSAISGIILSLTTQLRRAVELMYDLNKEYTNLSIVSKISARDLKEVNVQVDNLAISLGRLKKEIINSITEFTRVSNTTAINLEGIGEAFLRSANNLHNAGATLEQASALIASANESIQNPTKVGTALSTITSRIRGIKDGMPKLRDDLESVGVSLQNADGSFRNIYDILKDFAKVYKTLDDLTAESLVEKMAGKRQKNILISLLNNFKVAEKSLENAQQSAGEVAKANEKYLNSLEGITNKLKETWGQFLTTLSNQESFKSFLKFLTEFVKSLTYIIRYMPIVITLVGAFSIALFGLSGIPAILIGIVSGISAISEGFVLFGDNVDNNIRKINELKNKISELDSKIGDLKAIKDRTNEQNAYLESLERQLKIQKELLALEEEDMSDKYAKKYSKITSNYYISSYEHVKEQLKSISDKFGESSDIAQSYMDTWYKNLKKSESELINLKLELIDSNKILDENSVAFKKNEETIKNIDSTLSQLDEAYVLMGRNIVKVTESTQQLSLENSENLKKSFEDTISVIKELDGGYRELYTAQKTLEQNGYLTQDMLDGLIERFPNLVKETNLTAEGFKKFAESHRQDTESILKDQIAIEEANIQRAKSAISLANIEVESSGMVYKALLQSAGVSDVVRQTLISKNNKAIQDAKNNLALLTNELNKLNRVKKEVNSSFEKKATSKALTDLELSINKINFEIQKTKLLVSQTDDVDKRIKLNKNLIDLTKQYNKKLKEQQTQLEENNKSVKRGTKKYDDYIKSMQDLSLKIEQNMLDIYNYNKEIDDLYKKNNEKSIEKLKEYADNYESILDRLAKAYEKKFEDESETRKKAFNKEIDDLDAQLKELERKYEDYNNEIEKQDINKKLSDLAKERVQQEVIGNLDAKKRIAEIDKESADLKKQLSEQLRKEEYTKSKREIEDKKLSLQEQIKKEEDALKERLKNLENYTFAKTMLEEKGVNDVLDMLKKYDEDFAKDGLTKGEEWAKEFLNQVNVAIVQANNLKSGSVKNAESTINKVANKSIPSTSSNSVSPKYDIGTNKPSELSKQEKIMLYQLSKAWERATSQAEKDKWHKMAEDIRAKHGYSGGIDGSQYIPTSYNSSLSYNSGASNFSKSGQSNGNNINFGNIVINGANTSNPKELGKEIARTTRSELNSSGVRF